MSERTCPNCGARCHSLPRGWTRVDYPSDHALKRVFCMELDAPPPYAPKAVHAAYWGLASGNITRRTLIALMALSQNRFDYQSVRFGYDYSL